MKRIVLALLTLALLSGLVAFAYAGTYSRYWADDYCYSAAVLGAGLPRALGDWYATSGNRLSTLVVVALSELFGPGAIRFLPAALLALWALSAWVLLRALSRRLFASPPGGWWLAAASLALTFYPFLLAPDRLQTLYWRMGALHYSLPLPLLFLNLALVLRAAGSARIRPWPVVASALLAFFAAGLSETFAAMQAVLFAGLLGAPALRSFTRRGAGESPHPAGSWGSAVLLLAATLAATLAMMAVMASAPANAWRQAALPPPDNPLLILTYSLRFAAEFLFYTLRALPVPFAAFLTTAFALGLLLPSARTGPRAVLLGALGSLLAAYLLVAASFAPSAFAGLAYPAGRAQMPGSAAWLIGLASAACFAALGLRGLVTARRAGWVAAAALVLLLAGALYPVRALSAARSDAERLAARAARWDERDAAIRVYAVRAAAAGFPALTVRQTDVVQSLEDLGPDPDFWINRCAADFYGVPSITAEP